MQKVISNLKASLTIRTTNNAIKDALANLDKQNFRLAQEKLNKAIAATEQESIEELSLIFQNYASAKEYSKALFIGESISYLRQEDFSFLDHLGDVARRAHDLEKAEKFYRLSLSANPNYEKSLLNLAATLCKQNLYGQEVKRFIAPYLTLKTFALPEYRSDTPWEETAIEELKTGGNAELPFEEIANHMRQKISDNWLQNPTKKNKINAQNGLFNLGLYALKNRRGKAAKKAFERLENQKASIPNLVVLIAISMFYSKDIEGAIQLLNIQKNVEPQNRYLWLNLALMCFQTGKHLNGYIALIQTRGLLTATKGIWQADAIKDEGKRYFDTGDFTSALQCFEVILEEFHTSEIDELLAHCYTRLNQPELALNIFQELIDKGINSDSSKAQLMNLNTDFIDQAKGYLEKSSYNKAHKCINNALKIRRVLPSIELAININKALKNDKVVATLQEEQKSLVTDEEALGKKMQMQRLLRQGKESLVRQNFQEAISLLEKAYAIQKNAETFHLLEKVYTRLNQKRAATELKSDWSQYVQSQMKHHKFERGYRAPTSIL